MGLPQGGLGLHDFLGLGAQVGLLTFLHLGLEKQKKPPLTALRSSWVNVRIMIPSGLVWRFEWSGCQTS